MSVIGYLVQCEKCDARMLVTAEARDMRHCPDCLTERILEAIEAEDHTPDPPPFHQPYEPPLLPWELELLGRNDDDYPIGEVSI